MPRPLQSSQSIVPTVSRREMIQLTAAAGVGNLVDRWIITQRICCLFIRNGTTQPLSTNDAKAL